MLERLQKARFLESLQQGSKQQFQLLFNCKLKEDKVLQSQTYANQQINVAKDCPSIELNGQSLEIGGNFCHLSNIIDTSRSAVDSAVTRIWIEDGKFRYLLPLLTSRGLPFGATGRLYSTCVSSVILFGSDTWPDKSKM